MFGAVKSNASKSNAAASPGKRGIFSVIGADVTIVGDISAESDLHIDGIVTGDIACVALVQGSVSRIAGTVRAAGARIAGAIDGAVDAGTLAVSATARITGDVAYDNIEIETGARIDGQMRHRIPAASLEEPLRLVDASDEAA